MAYDKIGKGTLKRRGKRVVGLFIDGTGLDRAARRISRRVDLTALVRGVTSGINPIVARYYTLIPFEDDSRHRAFLDAVARAGLTVVVKRLPPKGITRQVTVDVEMASDICAFALGHSSFSSLSAYEPDGSRAESAGPGEFNGFGGNSNSIPLAVGKKINPQEKTPLSAPAETPSEPQADTQIERVVTVVCPSRELSYPIALVKELGIDTVTADFAKFNAGDILKSAAKWIDLSDSETIWRD